MIIKVDMLATKIYENNRYYNVISDQVKSILSCITELNDLYSGRELEYLFNKVLTQNTELNKIPNIVDNYSNYLEDLKFEYNNKVLDNVSYLNKMSSIKFNK